MKRILHQIYKSEIYKIKFFYTLFLRKLTLKIPRLYILFNENKILLYIAIYIFIYKQCYVTWYESKQSNATKMSIMHLYFSTNC